MKMKELVQGGWKLLDITNDENKSKNLQRSCFSYAEDFSIHP